MSDPKIFPASCGHEPLPSIYNVTSHPNFIMPVNGFKMFVTSNYFNNPPVSDYILKNQWIPIQFTMEANGKTYYPYSTDQQPENYPGLNAFDGGTMDFYDGTTKILTINFFGFRVSTSTPVSGPGSSTASPFYNCYNQDNQGSSEEVNQNTNIYFSFTIVDSSSVAFQDEFTICIIVPVQQSYHYCLEYTLSTSKPVKFCDLANNNCIQQK